MHGAVGYRRIAGPAMTKGRSSLVSTGATTAPKVFDIAGDLRVRRLGFGAMRITGPMAWGEPEDRSASIAVLRRAVDAGVTLIDTAEAYGPYVSEELIKEALHPYPVSLVIATKGGLVRTKKLQPVPIPLGRPEFLRQGVEMSLRRLGLERIDLYQLHRIDPAVPLHDQLGELDSLRQEGKIRHIGLSEVTVHELQQARALAPIASVQNRYSVAMRQSQDVLDYAAAEGIAFIPWAPRALGPLADPDSMLTQKARERRVTPAQLALAWLLHVSPVILPIPGTSNITHLDENVAAADINLTQDDVSVLSALGASG